MAVRIPIFTRSQYQSRGRRKVAPLGVLPKNQKEKQMSNQIDNRVLGRRGARLLTGEELNSVSGAAGTTTKCSFDPRTGQHDGDIGEC